MTTLAQVRALVDTDLADAALQEVLTREETSLARLIGPLTGSRAETFYPNLRPDTRRFGLMLRRPTASVTVTDAGVAVAPSGLLLRDDGRTVERLPTVTAAWAYWVGPVVVTYTPSDVSDVERVVIELVRQVVSETGYISETIGDYAYSRGASRSLGQRRAELIRPLLRRAPAHSTRVLTAREFTVAAAAWE